MSTVPSFLARAEANRVFMPMARLELIALLLASSVHAETITVCREGCDHASVNAAIESASDGDIIQLAAEAFAEGMVIDTLGKAVVLRGATDRKGLPVTILDGSYEHGVLLCISGEGPGTRFENLVVRNGSAVTGGGLASVASSPTIVNCRFEANFASSLGGAMWNYFSVPRLVDCVFVGNGSAESAGAVYNGTSAPDIIRCVFRENSATDLGGAIGNFTDSTPRFEDCVFMDNVALEGGGMFNYQSDPELIDCAFIGNSFYGNLGESFGGGMVNEAASPVLENCAFTANYGGEFGGAMANISGSAPILEACTFSNNQTAGLGPSIYNASSVPTLLDCVFEECCQIEPPRSFFDGGGNDLATWCDGCRANIDCRGDAVDAGDLGMLLAAWNSSDQQCDLNGDGRVDGQDLGQLFMEWGPCR